MAEDSLLSVKLEDRRLRRAFDRAEKNLTDLRPAFRRFDRTVGKYFRRRFETGGRFGGPTWKSLADETKKRRRKPLTEGGTPNIGGVDRPLWDSGNLKASFQEVGGESVRNIRRASYERGSRVPYASIHQEGKGVPKREIVPEDLESFPTTRSFLVNRLADLMEKHVTDPFGDEA